MDFVYSERFVAKIDFDTVVRQRGADASWLVDVLDLMRQIRVNFSGKSQFIHVNQFANGFFVTTTGATNEDFYSICVHVAGIVSHLLALGYLVRGSISLGYMYHDQDILCGPALWRASELTADYRSLPRVVVDNALPISHVPEILFAGSDGVRFLDVFSPGLLYDFWGLHPAYVSKIQLPAFDLNGPIALIAEIEKEESNPDLRAEYGWLKAFMERERKMPG
jgi:hypothetical protein